MSTFKTSGKIPHRFSSRTLPPEKGKNLNNIYLASVRCRICPGDMTYLPTMYIFKHNRIYDKSYFLVLCCCRSLHLSGRLE